jgi:hypothetical protein
VKTCINRKELDHYNNQLSFNKFVVKSVMNALGLSKATEKFAREENRGKRQETKRRTTIGIVEPPTNAILALILHLIWRDLTENQHGRAPPCWGSSTSPSPPHPPERTKGGEHDPIVLADGAVATEIIHATTASIQYTLHTKHNSGSRSLDQTTGGHHFVHDGRIKKGDTGHEPTRGL